MKKELSKSSMRTLIMLSLIPLMVLMIYIASDNGLTIGALAILATIVIYGKWIAYEAKQYSKRRGMGNFEEFNLAWSYQNNSIGKMYRNVIIILVPLLIFGGYYVDDYIIHKEYTHRLTNNFDVQIESMANDDSMIDMSGMLKDPIVKLLLEQGDTKEITLCGLMTIDTAVNAARTISALSITKNFIAYDGEADADGMEQIREELNKSIERIDKVYSKTLIDKTSTNEVDKLTVDVVSLNNAFKDINIEMLEALSNETLTAEIYKEAITDFNDELKVKMENTKSSMDNLMEKMKDTLWIDVILTRVGVLMTIFAILRVIGIVKYYFRLRRYRRSIVTE